MRTFAFVLLPLFLLLPSLEICREASGSAFVELYWQKCCSLQKSTPDSCCQQGKTQECTCSAHSRCSGCYDLPVQVQFTRSLGKTLLLSPLALPKFFSFSSLFSATSLLKGGELLFSPVHTHLSTVVLLF